MKKTQKEEKFSHLVNKLLQTILKETDIKKEDCYTALSTLMEEDLVEDLKKELKGQIEETGIKKEKKKKKLIELLEKI